MTSDIAPRLRVLRRKAGLTQNDCAHLLGVHTSRVSAIETGKALPSIREISILALIYGKSFDTLLAGTTEEARKGLAEKLGTLPPAPRFWLGRFNRHHTLNALAVRLEVLSAPDHGCAG